MKKLKRLFLTGVAILVVAIIVNAVALRLGLSTWYGFAGRTGSLGLSGAIRQLSLSSILFLFIIYPLIPGYIAKVTLNKLK